MITKTIRRKNGLRLVALAAVLVAAGCGQNGSSGNGSADNMPAAPARLTAGTGAGTVDAQRIINANSEPGNWMTTGRTYGEQRYSPLKKINDGNVGKLGLAWYVDLDTKRGQEATPIVVDGVMYESTAWSKVMALNAKTGKVLWKYDPKVRRESARDACCDVVNRGVAVWKGKVYVGALDGRLIALDAKTGKVVWDVQTTPVDQALHDHRRAARHQGQCHHRQWRRGVKCPRLCLGL